MLKLCDLYNIWPQNVHESSRSKLVTLQCWDDVKTLYCLHLTM